MTKEQEFDANLTITRDSDNIMRIRIQDETSQVVFVELKLSLEDMMKCITGLGYVDCKAIYRNLQAVGKTKIMENRVINTGLRSYDRDKMEQWLKDNAQEEGWILDPYLGSQSSMFHIDNMTHLRYTVYKYI